MQPRSTGSTRGCSARRFAVPSAAAPTRVGTPGWYLRRHPRSCAAPSRERASAAELTGAVGVGVVQIIKSEVTTLLRCDSAGCEVTALLRIPWKPASLLGFGRSAIVVNGGVTTLVSQLRRHCFGLRLRTGQQAASVARRVLAGSAIAMVRRMRSGRQPPASRLRALSNPLPSRCLPA